MEGLLIAEVKEQLVLRSRLRGRWHWIITKEKMKPWQRSKLWEKSNKCTIWTKSKSNIISDLKQSVLQNWTELKHCEQLISKLVRVPSSSSLSVSCSRNTTWPFPVNKQIKGINHFRNCPCHCPSQLPQEWSSLTWPTKLVQQLVYHSPPRQRFRICSSTCYWVVRCWLEFELWNEFSCMAC